MEANILALPNLAILTQQDIIWDNENVETFPNEFLQTYIHGVVLAQPVAAVMCYSCCCAVLSCHVNFSSISLHLTSLQWSESQY